MNYNKTLSLANFRLEWAKETNEKKRKHELMIESSRLQEERAELVKKAETFRLLVFSLNDVVNEILQYLIPLDIRSWPIIHLKRTCLFFRIHPVIKKLENDSNTRFRIKRYILIKEEEEEAAAKSIALY